MGKHIERELENLKPSCSEGPYWLTTPKPRPMVARQCSAIRRNSRGSRKGTVLTPRRHLHSSTVSARIPFTVKLLAHPHKRESEAVVIDGGFHNRHIAYVVQPAKAWDELRVYRNFIRGKVKFPVGSFVYINRCFPPPSSPPPGSSEEAILDYDRSNFWIAKILEIRATDSTPVFVRVVYLYWPEELPSKRKPYHGAGEVIMSNHMDIVDARAVAGPAEVTYWDEQDETQVLAQIFFRQFYNVQNLGGDEGSELSMLRQYCRCKQYYNPDTTMYCCRNVDCEIWIHESCLIEQALQHPNKSQGAWEVKVINDEVDGTVKLAVKQKLKCLNCGEVLQ